jgi:hypothetical protein
MPRVGFQPKTPVFERAKAVHTSDCHCDRRSLNKRMCLSPTFTLKLQWLQLLDADRVPLLLHCQVLWRRIISWVVEK